MPIFHLKKQSILFVHIPKTGGMSVEKSFSTQGPISLKNPNLHKELGFPCSPQHFHAEILEKLYNVNRVFSYRFAIVRDPLQRLISEYKFRLRTPEQRKNISFNKWADKVIKKYQTNPYILDNHIRPQNEFICENCEVFKMEGGFDNIFNELNVRLSPPKTLENTQVNKSPAGSISYSKTTQSIIEDFYNRDYELFDYKS